MSRELIVRANWGGNDDIVFRVTVRGVFNGDVYHIFICLPPRRLQLTVCVILHRLEADGTKNELVINRVLHRERLLTSFPSNSLREFQPHGSLGRGTKTTLPEGANGTS